MKKNSNDDLKNKFASQLFQWNKKYNVRQMPWKGEKDPYKIWLSEIILQQTRVEQGLSYYKKFINTFPDIHKLANAPDTKIFKLWEGLGYYTRCRNLIATARYISKELRGKFPDTYEEIRSLKGIGPYTAAAIASFGFSQPYAVVDGNVFRVLARIFGIDKPIDSTKGKVFFSNLANELLDKKQPAIYNQAIMDFGAVVCKPALPLCTECPFNKRCSAYLSGKVNELPVKGKKVSIKKRWFYYLVMENENYLVIQQRIAKDIWQHLYEFPLVEVENPVEENKILKQAERKGWLQKKGYKVIAVSPLLQQKLSHQLIYGRFIKIRLKQKPTLKSNWEWVFKNKRNKYPFPRFINQYLQYQDR